MELHPCGCIFPLSQEIIEAVTSGKLEAIAGAGAAEIPGRTRSAAETHVPRAGSRGTSAPPVSAVGAQTEADISGVTRLRRTEQSEGKGLHPGWQAGPRGRSTAT